MNGTLVALSFFLVAVLVVSSQTVELASDTSELANDLDNGLLISQQEKRSPSAKWMRFGKRSPSAKWMRFGKRSPSAKWMRFGKRSGAEPVDFVLSNY